MATADQLPLQDADRERALARMLHHLDPAGIGTVIDRALSTPDHHQCTESLIALAPAPPKDRQATVMDQAILATRRIERHDPRAGTFADSLPILETARREQVVKEALRTVAAISDNEEYVSPLEKIAQHLTLRGTSAARWQPPHPAEAASRT